MYGTLTAWKEGEAVVVGQPANLIVSSLLATLMLCCCLSSADAIKAYAEQDPPSVQRHVGCSDQDAQALLLRAMFWSIDTFISCTGTDAFSLSRFP